MRTREKREEKDLMNLIGNTQSNGHESESRFTKQDEFWCRYDRCLHLRGKLARLSVSTNISPLNRLLTQPDVPPVCCCGKRTVPNLQVDNSTDAYPGESILPYQAKIRTWMRTLDNFVERSIYLHILYNYHFELSGAMF